MLNEQTRTRLRPVRFVWKMMVYAFENWNWKVFLFLSFEVFLFFFNNLHFFSMNKIMERTLDGEITIEIFLTNIVKFILFVSHSSLLHITDLNSYGFQLGIQPWPGYFPLFCSISIHLKTKIEKFILLTFCLYTNMLFFVASWRGL